MRRPTPKPTSSGTDTGGASDSGASDSGEADSGEADSGEADSGEPAPAKPADGSPFAHLYWSWGDDTMSTVDITDAKAGTGKDDDLWKLMEECDECNGRDKLLDPKDKRLPSEYKVGDKWIVVDGDGPHVGTVKGFGIEGGASEGHFYVLRSRSTICASLPEPRPRRTQPLPRERTPTAMTRRPATSSASRTRTSTGRRCRAKVRPRARSATPNRKTSRSSIPRWT